jgi:hypothetical protein
VRSIIAVLLEIVEALSRRLRERKFDETAAVQRLSICAVARSER